MRSERKRLLNDEGETGRLVAFCDGVFAVAMTVLVFNLQVPQPGAQVTASETLLTALGKQLPIYASYASRFMLSSIYLLNHPPACRHIKRADRLLLVIKLLHLKSIEVLPF